MNEVSITFYDEPFRKRDSNDTQYQLTPRNLQHLVADVAGKQLHLLNTQGIWGTDGNDNERRLKMGDLIVREVGSDAPLLLAGDFNVNEKTHTIAKIEEKLVNVFKDALVTSFNLKHKDLVKDPGFATSVVDMMFLSPDVKILSKSVPQADVSDHLPLICEIEI